MRRGTNLQEPGSGTDSADTAPKSATTSFDADGSGRKLAARDRRVLTAVATQGSGEAARAGEAGQAEAIARSMRAAPVAAGRRSATTPGNSLAAAKVVVFSLRTEDVAFPEDTAELIPSRSPSTNSPPWSQTYSVRRAGCRRELRPQPRRAY